MICENGYYRLIEKFKELVAQSLNNELYGLTNSRELNCAIVKAKGLLMLHNFGILTGRDLVAWGEQVSEIVGEAVICEEVGNQGPGSGGSSGTGGGGQAGPDEVWLPKEFECEVEELVWEAYEATCEGINNVIR